MTSHPWLDVIVVLLVIWRAPSAYRNWRAVMKRVKAR